MTLIDDDASIALIAEAATSNVTNVELGVTCFMAHDDNAANASTQMAG